MISVGAIEQEEKTVAAGLRQKFFLLAVELRIEQDRRFHGVPIMHIVRGRLKIPGQFSGVGIERDDGTGI